MAKGYWKYVGDINHIDIGQSCMTVNYKTWRQFDVDGPDGFYFYEPDMLQSGSFVVQEVYPYPYTELFYKLGVPPAYNTDIWEDEFSDHLMGYGPSGPVYLVSDNDYSFYRPGTFSFNYYFVNLGDIGPQHTDVDWVYPGGGGYPEMHVVRWYRDATNPEYSRIRDPILHYSYQWQEQPHIKEVAHNAVLITKGAEPYPDNPHVFSIRQAVVGVNSTDIDSGTINWTKWADRPPGFSYLAGYDGDYPEIRVYATYHNEYEWDIGGRCYSSGGVNGTIQDIGIAKTEDLTYSYYSPLNSKGVISGTNGPYKDTGLLYIDILPGNSGPYMPTHIFGYEHDYSSGPDPEYDNVTTSITSIRSIDINKSVELGTIEVPMEVLVPMTYNDNGNIYTEINRLMNHQLTAISFTEDGIPNIASQYGDIYLWNGTSYDHVVDTRKWNWDKDEIKKQSETILYTWNDGFWQGYGFPSTKRTVYYTNKKVYLITEKMVGYTDNSDDLYTVSVWQYIPGIGTASVGKHTIAASKNMNGKG